MVGHGFWKKVAVHPLLSTWTAHTCTGSILFKLPFQGEVLRESESWLHGEPSIQEVMSDPIVHLVMRRDGLTPESVWAVIQAASVKLQVKPKEVADCANGDVTGTGHLGNLDSGPTPA